MPSIISPFGFPSRLQKRRKPNKYTKSMSSKKPCFIFIGNYWFARFYPKFKLTGFNDFFFRV